jgi:tetratricopeptide (TPR) repeat protein
MMKRSVVAAICTLALLVVSSVEVRAQGRDENWSSCRDLGGNPDLALAACTVLIQSGQESTANLVAALGNRSIWYRRKDDLDRAMADIERALTMSAESSAVVRAMLFGTRARVHSSKVDFDAAIRDYTTATEIDPSAYLNYNNRGNTYLRQKQYDVAIADFQHASRLDPSRPLPFYNLGRSFQQKGEYAAALDNFAEAIRLDPNHYGAITGRASVYAATGDYDRALAEADRAVAMNPGGAPSLNARGLFYHYKREYDRAIEDYERALALDKHAFYFSNRGHAYLQKQEYDKALIDFETSINLDKTSAWALYGRGVIKRMRGDVASSDADVAAAKELQEDIATDMERLGVVLPATPVHSDDARRSADGVPHTLGGLDSGDSSAGASYTGSAVVAVAMLLAVGAVAWLIQKRRKAAIDNPQEAP